MTHYQAVVIGFGKAGKTLAANLAKNGWKVAIIEQSNEMYGGTCINIGCIPTKSLAHDAQSRHSFSDAMERKSDLVRFLRNKNFDNLAELSNVNIIDGRGEFIDCNTIRVITLGNEELVIHGEKFFINTGAQPKFPDIDGITTTSGVYDSTGLLSLSERPEHLGILGGGYIGVEFASMFANFGSKVTIFEAGDRFLPREDEDVAAAIIEILNAQGVEIILNAKVQSISGTSNAVKIHLVANVTTVDALLVASGRTPATEQLKLENAGVELNERGAIRVDQYLRTSASHIWAMGDVNGGPQFTYISLDDFRIVYDQLCGDGKRNTRNRQNIPYSVFMTPTLSRIGLNETQAKNSRADIQIITLPAAAISRARVMNETRGLLKAIIDNNTKSILGVSLLCIDSHEMINIVKTVMDANLPYTVLRDQVFTHPTMSESFNDIFSAVR